MKHNNDDRNTPVMEIISHRLTLLSNMCDLPMIWKVGIQNQVTLKLPKRHNMHCHQFCQTVKKCHISFENRCIYNDIVLVSKILQEKKQPFCNRCYAGCQELIVPIYYGDCYIATIFVGPFRMAGDNNPCITPEARQVYDTMPCQSEEKIQALMEFIPGFFKDLLPDMNPNISSHLVQPIQRYAEYPAIMTAMDYAKRHLRDRITISQIAAKCSMSVSNFQHFFRRITGYSFSEYLQRIRILEAEKLLLYTQLPIGEIAILCRLTDQSRMTMLFRNYYDLTPAVLRKKFHRNSLANREQITS